MTVKFAGPPNLQKIRSVMEHAVKGEVSVHEFQRRHSRKQRLRSAPSCRKSSS